ncbi:binuclear zinc transcription factor [Colletotrichum chrysophilum]|uniref:Binuclear zinc transcription factor n=1 Tax=Colletotrichum chrysophilum TaxID=1836956 RepID=A0AAD9ED72_9PEZI|nr:binuclear zinc transcription factor [Colletotrichum chrysophilum]
MQTHIPKSGSRRPTTRTTTGCQTCRRRRIKCDEVKPSCQRCQYAAIDCSYKPQLKWPRQGARMGNNRSRRHRVQSDASTQKTDSLLSEETRLETFSVDRLEEPIHAMFVSAASCTSGPDVDDNHDLASRIDLGMNQFSTDNRALLASMPSKTCSLSISSLGDPYQLPNMKREDSMLFHYYVAEMCPQCIVRNGYNKSYRQVILPLVNKSNILLRAILAFTANRVKLQDDRFRTVALRHQAAVLQGLQQ